MPERVELLVEIIGVLPKLPAQLRLARADLERFQNRGHDDGGQRTGVNVGMGVEAEVLQRLARARRRNRRARQRLSRRCRR